MNSNSKSTSPKTVGLDASRIEPGTVLWGHFPTHDRGPQWHPAMVLRVTRDAGRTIVTAALGSSRQVHDDHAPTEFVCFADDAEFALTGLRTSTRFNMDGLRFKFVAGTKQEAIIGEISEEATPTLYRRLILACQHATLR